MPVDHPITGQAIYAFVTLTVVRGPPLQPALAGLKVTFKVLEAFVVHMDHPINTQATYAFVTLMVVRSPHPPLDLQSSAMPCSTPGHYLKKHGLHSTPSSRPCRLLRVDRMPCERTNDAHTDPRLTRTRSCSLLVNVSLVVLGGVRRSLLWHAGHQVPPAARAKEGAHCDRAPGHRRHRCPRRHPLGARCASQQNALHIYNNAHQQA